MTTSTLHEPAECLTVKIIDVHRAIISLIEELEAVDWYNQRAEAAKDPQLQAVIKHNRDEEIEHACMTLEWNTPQCLEVRRSVEIIPVHKRGNHRNRGNHKGRKERGNKQAETEEFKAHDRRNERELRMGEEERATGVIASELMNRIEEAAIAAAREILSGRRIIDVDGPYGIGLTTVEVGNDDRYREPGPEEASAVVSHALSVPMIYRRFAISKRRIAAPDSPSI